MPSATTPSASASSSKIKVKGSKPGRTTPAATDSATDIDSIFAKPGKAKTAVAQTGTASSSKSQGKKRSMVDDGDTTDVLRTGGDVKEKKKKKKQKSDTTGNGENTSTPTTTAPTKVPETSRVVEVVDTSIPKVKAAPPAVAKIAAKGKGKKDKKEAEEDEMFADSRGTGPREWLCCLCEVRQALRCMIRPADRRRLLDLQRGGAANRSGSGWHAVVPVRLRVL